MTQTIARSAGQAIVGEIDPLSNYAALARVPLCGRARNGTPYCTRAAGHDEGDWKQGHASQHVSTDADYIVLRVLS